MRLSWSLPVLSLCLSALATAAAGAEGGKRKLQIGVKKRVDHCPIKSRKGDVLHMHYTVGKGAAPPLCHANQVDDLGLVSGPSRHSLPPSGSGSPESASWVGIYISAGVCVCVWEEVGTHLPLLPP